MRPPPLLVRDHLELVDAVREYLAELDNPAPDYNLRRILRDRLRNLVK